jgi:hypothetical protein
VSSKKWNTTFTLIDPASASFFIYNFEQAERKKFVCTGILIDCDISAGGSYAEISDQRGSNVTPIITFNVLFYKGFYLDLSSAPPEFYTMQLHNASAATGRISLTFFGLLEDL